MLSQQFEIRTEAVGWRSESAGEEVADRQSQERQSPSQMVCHLNDSFRVGTIPWTAARRPVGLRFDCSWRGRSVCLCVGRRECRRDWLAWGYRQVDRHLRQFGV